MTVLNDNPSWSGPPAAQPEMPGMDLRAIHSVLDALAQVEVGAGHLPASQHRDRAIASLRTGYGHLLSMLAETYAGTYGRRA